MRWWVTIWVAALITLMAGCEQGPPATPKAVVPTANLPTFAASPATPQPSATAGAQVDAPVSATTTPATKAVSAVASLPGSALPASPVSASPVTASPAAQMTVLEGIQPQDGKCPTDHPVKGSVDEQTHQKLFYSPADASYEQAKPEQCFATEQDATAAGYQPPPN